MSLKEELAEKLAGIDCKDKIKEVMDEKTTSKKHSTSTEKTKARWTRFKKGLFLASCLCSPLLLGYCIGVLVLTLILGV